MTPEIIPARNKKIATSVSIVFLFVALLDGLPYGFFTLLRLLVFGTTIYLAWLAYKVSKPGWVYGFGLIAFLFNPLIPQHLGRELWVVVDFLVGVFLFVSLFVFKLEKRDTVSGGKVGK